MYTKTSKLVFRCKICKMENGPWDWRRPKPSRASVANRQLCFSKWQIPSQIPNICRKYLGYCFALVLAFSVCFTFFSQHIEAGALSYSSGGKPAGGHNLIMLAWMPHIWVCQASEQSGTDQLSPGERSMLTCWSFSILGFKRCTIEEMEI